MEEAVPINTLNRDMLIEILARADGPAIVSASCTSTGLWEASQEKSLWENLCQTAWPSTKEQRVHDIISSSCGFAKFYSNSLPLVLYNPEQQRQQQRQQQQGFISTPSELVSLVDVFYRGVCVFSNVVHGIPMHNTGSWFLDCPFRLDALDDGASPPLMAEGEGPVKEVCERLDELRLSWVLLDSRNGVAVNLSSWRPTLIEKNWPSEGNLLVRFSCALPVDQQLLGDAGGVECVIELRFRVLGRPMAMTELRMVEVTLQVEDVDGMHVNGRGSLMVLYWALSCSTRSRDRRAVEEGHLKYQSKQKAALEMKNREESLVDRMCALSGTALFAFVCLSGYHFLM